MADTLAYFSARDKGGPYVMAVTVQEQHSPFLKGGRIDAFVSGNDIPPQKTIGLLQDTLHIMEDCAIRGGKSSSMSTAWFVLQKRPSNLVHSDINYCELLLT